MKRYPLKEIKNFESEILRSKVLDSIMKEGICNYSQFRILKHLLESATKEEIVYQKDFENLLNIRKSTISGILDTMEKNKIIIRTIDNKGKVVELTSEMLKYRKKILDRLEALEAKLVEGISEDELETFYNVMDKMKENIKNID